jgi:hypothetical protein
MFASHADAALPDGSRVVGNLGIVGVFAMSDDNPKREIREVTRNVYESLIRDEWPRPAGIVDFGLKTTDHLGALQWAVRDDGVTIEQLDEALGSGPKIQALISDTNPYRFVKFETDWDNIPQESEAAVFEIQSLATPEGIRIMPTKFENPNLMPDEIAKTIPPLYSQEDVSDPIAHVKYFTPDSSWTWYVTEYDPDPEERRAFGLVYGHEAELGDISIAELESIRGPAGLPIVRDPDFEPRPLSRCDDPCQIHENPLKPTLKHSL